MKNTWIETYKNNKINPFYPEEKDIDIEDVAWSLSMKCRFNGHSNRYFSVAEHSILVSRLSSMENALYGLLHDAGEAYLPDIPRPLKKHINGFNEIEENLLKVILKKYGLKEEIPEEIHYIDGKICMTEALYLGFDTRKDGWEFGIKTGKEIYDDLEIHCWNHKIAYEVFLSEFKKLCYNRK